MGASYKKIWKILIFRDTNRSKLISLAKIASNITAKISKGKYVTM